MKLRTQLLLAFCLLAIGPLSAIVLYSYVSSEGAFREAVESESAELAEEMKDRLSDERQDLRRRLRGLEDAPLEQWINDHLGGGGEESLAPALEVLRRELGPSLGLLERVELTFDPPELPPVPADTDTSAGAATDTEAGTATGVDADAVAGTGSATGSEPEAPEPPAPPRPPPSSIVILAQERPAPSPAPVPPAVPEPDGEAGPDAGGEDAEESGPVTPDSATPDSATSDSATSGADASDAQAPGSRATGPESDDRDLPDLVAALVAVADGAGQGVLRDLGEGVRRRIEFPLRQDGQLIGRLQARIRAERLVDSVLGTVRVAGDEVAFAVDKEGNLYTKNAADREIVEPLWQAEALTPAGAGQSTGMTDGWILVTREVPATGLSFGVARPVKDSLQQIRRSAVRNLFFGIVLVGLAFLGILPLTAHITRHLSALTRGAERIAAGDLQARVPVYSENEIGQLARTFNRMAFELSENQRQLLDQERRRREQEIQQHLLEAENSRKTRELDEARAFQLSLLPKSLPRAPGVGVAVYTRTATEVGGDYYDFHLHPDGTLTVAIGDATGHGARAGTMVAVIKSLFSSHGASEDLPRFLSDASRTVKSMDLRRMAMSLALVRLQDRRLTISSAGMPPVLVYRRGGGEVEEVAIEGMPLGGLAGYPYRQRETEVEPGDTVLMMSDGFPEMLGEDGEAVGYGGVRRLFRAAAPGSPQDVVDSLARAVSDLTGDRSPADDTTFVVLKVE